MRNAKMTILFSSAMVILGLMTVGSARAQGSAQNDLAGFYVGAIVGHADGSYQSASSPEIDHEPSGQFVGLRAGWNRASGLFVFGIDADVAFASIDGEDTVTVSGFKSDVSDDFNYLSTLRVRVGGRTGRAMLYGTAGFAFAELDNKLVVSTSGQEVGRDDVRSRHTGWTAGAGLEVPLTQRISITTEYFYVDMQEEEITVNIGTFPFTDKGDLNLNTLRFGVNFRF